MIALEVIEHAQQRVGRTLCGKWRLDRVLGVGGMATVYEATHRNNHRVAIKVLHPVLSLEEGTRERFLREGYVANTIDHRGAVRILDDDTAEDGAAFLVMELLRGENVEQRAERRGGVLPVREALALIDQLLDLLSVAHDRNVIHRDIKPDNLFWTEDGELKLLDFGIARLSAGTSAGTRVGSFMGTPAFSAPEQARGRWDEVDARTDLFAVGATLFTLVTGFHVHEAETSSEQLALAVCAAAPSLSSVAPDAAPELVELVDRALSYEKEDRFQSARAFRAAVQRVASLVPDGLVLGAPRERVSLVAGTLSGPPRFWVGWSSPLSRLVLGAVASVGLALLLLRLAPPDAASRDVVSPSVVPSSVVPSSEGFSSRALASEREPVRPDLHEGAPTHEGSVPSDATSAPDSSLERRTYPGQGARSSVASSSRDPGPGSQLLSTRESLQPGPGSGATSPTDPRESGFEGTLTADQVGPGQKASNPSPGSSPKVVGTAAFPPPEGPPQGEVADTSPPADDLFGRRH